MMRSCISSQQQARVELPFKSERLDEAISAVSHRRARTTAASAEFGQFRQQALQLHRARFALASGSGAHAHLQKILMVLCGVLE